MKNINQLKAIPSLLFSSLLFSSLLFYSLLLINLANAQVKLRMDNKFHIGYDTYTPFLLGSSSMFGTDNDMILTK